MQTDMDLNLAWTMSGEPPRTGGAEHRNLVMPAMAIFAGASPVGLSGASPLRPVGLPPGLGRGSVWLFVSGASPLRPVRPTPRPLSGLGVVSCADANRGRMGFA